MLCLVVAMSACEVIYPHRWHVTTCRHIWVDQHVRDTVKLQLQPYVMIYESVDP